MNLKAEKKFLLNNCILSPKPIGLFSDEIITELSNGICTLSGIFIGRTKILYEQHYFHSGERYFVFNNIRYYFPESWLGDLKFTVTGKTYEECVHNAFLKATEVRDSGILQKFILSLINKIRKGDVYERPLWGVEAYNLSKPFKYHIWKNPELEEYSPSGKFFRKGLVPGTDRWRSKYFTELFDPTKKQKEKYKKIYCIQEYNWDDDGNMVLGKKKWVTKGSRHAGLKQDRKDLRKKEKEKRRLEKELAEQLDLLFSGVENNSEDDGSYWNVEYWDWSKNIPLDFENFDGDS